MDQWPANQEQPSSSHCQPPSTYPLLKLGSLTSPQGYANLGTLTCSVSWNAPMEDTACKAHSIGDAYLLLPLHELGYLLMPCYIFCRTSAVADHVEIVCSCNHDARIETISRCLSYPKIDTLCVPALTSLMASNEPVICSELL